MVLPSLATVVEGLAQATSPAPQTPNTSTNNRFAALADLGLGVKSPPSQRKGKHQRAHSLSRLSLQEFLNTDDETLANNVPSTPKSQVSGRYIGHAGAQQRSISMLSPAPSQVAIADTAKATEVGSTRKDNRHRRVRSEFYKKSPMSDITHSLDNGSVGTPSKEAAPSKVDNTPNDADVVKPSSNVYVDELDLHKRRKANDGHRRSSVKYYKGPPIDDGTTANEGDTNLKHKRRSSVRFAIPPIDENVDAFGAPPVTDSATAIKVQPHACVSTTPPKQSTALPIRQPVAKTKPQSLRIDVAKANLERSVELAMEIESDTETVVQSPPAGGHTSASPLTGNDILLPDVSPVQNEAVATVTSTYPAQGSINDRRNNALSYIVAQPPRDTTSVLSDTNVSRWKFPMPFAEPEIKNQPAVTYGKDMATALGLDMLTLKDKRPVGPQTFGQPTAHPPPARYNNPPRPNAVVPPRFRPAPVIRQPYGPPSNIVGIDNKNFEARSQYPMAVPKPSTGPYVAPYAGPHVWQHQPAPTQSTPVQVAPNHGVQDQAQNQIPPISYKPEETWKVPAASGLWAFPVQIQMSAREKIVSDCGQYRSTTPLTCPGPEAVRAVDQDQGLHEGRLPLHRQDPLPLLLQLSGGKQGSAPRPRRQARQLHSPPHCPGGGLPCPSWYGSDDVPCRHSPVGRARHGPLPRCRGDCPPAPAQEHIPPLRHAGTRGRGHGLPRAGGAGSPSELRLSFALAESSSLFLNFAFFHL